MFSWNEKAGIMLRALTSLYTNIVRLDKINKDLQWLLNDDVISFVVIFHYNCRHALHKEKERSEHAS